MLSMWIHYSITESHHNGNKSQCSCWHDGFLFKWPRSTQLVGPGNSFSVLKIQSICSNELLSFTTDLDKRGRKGSNEEMNIATSAWSMPTAISPASFVNFFGIQVCCHMHCHTSASLCVKELRQINELCHCTTSRAQWLTYMTDINYFTWHETAAFLQNAGHSPEYPPVNGNCWQSPICHLRKTSNISHLWQKDTTSL